MSQDNSAGNHRWCYANTTSTVPKEERGWGCRFSDQPPDNLTAPRCPLLKYNVDSGAALSALATRLATTPKAFNVAGTKDKRGGGGWPEGGRVGGGCYWIPRRCKPLRVGFNRALPWTLIAKNMVGCVRLLADIMYLSGVSIRIFFSTCITFWISFSFVSI